VTGRNGYAVPEAELEQTDAGLVPAGNGWFVLNAHDAPWVRRDRRGHRLPFTGSTERDDANFPQIGVSVFVLEPGEPIGMYHWEADQEDFLVLAGEALLLVEGQERRLRQWDFVHCPPHTNHMIVGAGDAQCTVLAVGAREHQTGSGWGGYPVDDVALRHGAGVEQETNDVEVAYARFAEPEPTRYRDGLLPW
jgi:uncharacterized cupin superfamily protein